jgi:hypothetical protein
VWLGWNNRVAGPDTLKRGVPATYSLTLPDTLATSWRVGPQSALYVSLAATNAKPGPRAAPRDTTKKPAADSGKRAPAPKLPPPPKEKPDSSPVDLSVELVDAAGTVARLPISRFGIARRPLDVRLYRRDGRDAQRFTSISELVPQTFVMPVSLFAEAAPAFDVTRLRTIRLVFDRTEAGTVVLESVGLSTPVDAAFLAAVAPPVQFGRGGGKRP